MYTIGRLAHRAGVNADSIRFYERQGLLAPSQKTASGYRLYADDALRRLAFIKHAQRCGFNLADIRELLAFDSRDERARAGAIAVAERKLAEIGDVRVALTRMEQALTDLLAASRDASSVGGERSIVVAFEAASGAGPT